VQYYGQFAEKYGQTERWHTRIIPGMLRTLPAVSQGGSILDLGCGAGHFYPYAKQKGYQRYVGVDLSGDMIKRAQLSYSEDEFLVASATEFAHLFSDKHQKFDAIVCIMMLSTVSSMQDLIAVFKESYAVLKHDGILIICNPHPAFNPYMLSRSAENQIKTVFSGYYANGSQYDVTRCIGGTPLEFTDYHWALETIVNCMIIAGFRLSTIDECQPVDDAMSLPSHIIFVASKSPQVPLE
jgi:2-polyprenyl-3-methyl-5-hydroxy-6-metoxy-1,4-benzoquinol methylase